MRDDVVGVQLEGALDRGPVSPVRDLQQHAPEVTLLLVEAFDARDGVVGSADGGDVVLEHPLDVVGTLGHREPRLVVVEVANELLTAVADVVDRLVACLGDVDVQHAAQAVAVHLASVLGGDLARDLPVARERVEAGSLAGGDAEHPEVVLAGHAAARRRHRARHAHLGIRHGERTEVRVGVAHRVPVRLLGDELAAEESQDDVDALVHAPAGVLGLDPHHQRVRREQARPGAEHHATPRHVIELDDAVGHVQRVVIRQRDNSGPEPDVLRALRRGRDEDLGRVDGLESRRVVLADPRLLETQPVEELAQLQVAFHGERRVLRQ